MMTRVSGMIYIFLPSYLKPFFEYFFLFPFNHIICKDALLSIWIAEGFVEYSTDYSIMFSSASQFFDELRFCSLIEDGMNIHHLIRELSCHVVSKHYFRPGTRRQQEAADKLTNVSLLGTKIEAADIAADELTHISLLGTKIEEADIEWLIHARSVCTIFLEAGTQKFWFGFLDRLTNWKSLRVLDFSEADGVIELPSSISELKQLRYLRLYRCCIRSLPNAICYLSNLQTLEVEWCGKLLTLPEEFGYLSNLCRLSFNMTGISGLPASFYNLTNLRELNLNDTGICSDLSESVCRLSKLEKLKCHGLSSFPLQLGALMQLRCLSDYSVGKEDSCGGIKVLKDLIKLEGAICISGLENIGSREEARSADLKNKEFLQELILKWTSRSNVKNELDLEISQALVPFSRVKSVSFVDYAGEIFPDWLSMTNYLPFLDTVVISCCSRGRTLDLPRNDLIRRVEIRSCPQLNSVNLQIGDYKKSKMNLDELIIVDCPNLEYIPESALCINRKLQKQNCSKLQINLDRLVNKMLNFASLELLHVECYGTHLSLKQLLVNDNLSLLSLPLGLRILTSLRIVELHHCPSFDRIHRNALPLNIRKLRISGCPVLPYLPTTLHTFTSLRSLKLHDLPQLRMLPNDALPANLIKLHVTDCNFFKFFPPRLRVVLHISNCHEIKSITAHQLPVSLRQLLLHDCENLESLTNEGIGNLTNLQTLQLTNCRKLLLLPSDLLSLTSLKELRVDYSSIRESKLPTTLKKLKVWGHERLPGFPQQFWLRSLSSLQRLKISEFPQLQSLPKDIPSSLHHLSICDCPALTILPGEIYKLNSLVKLKIINCKTAESFGEIDLPSKLVELTIMNCEELKYLPKTLISLNCLESLSVSACPELELRLEDKLPDNLSMLKINECPKLVLSWNIIEHIPFRYIS